MIGFVRSVAPQLEERGIRINAVAPGFVETPLIDSAPFADAGFPLLQPEGVAQAVLEQGDLPGLAVLLELDFLVGPGDGAAPGAG